MSNYKPRTVGNHQDITILDPIAARSHSKIFNGVFDERKVAVKRLEFEKDPSKEIEILRKVDHSNVVKYLYTDEDEEFFYIVLEKCDCTLQQYVQKKVRISLSKVEVLRQITDGMNYLHNENDFCNVHRDLKPSNIMFVKSGKIWKVKITDFGISKYIPFDRTSVTRTSSGGSRGFLSPEELREGDTRIRKESDIFSLGVVFYYLLSNGKHPYGNDDLKWDSNIRDGVSPVLTGMEKIYVEDATSLISSMLVHDFEKRIKIEQIKAHHLFWDADRKVTFFQVVSDYLEDRTKHQTLINKLEKEGIENGVAVDWRERLESETESEIVRSTVGKLGKNRKNLQDLIRLVRNWNNHFHDAKTPEELRKELGGVPDGLLKFFTSRFPKLSPFVYDLMKSENVPHLEKFYSAKVEKGTDAHTTPGVSTAPSSSQEMEVDEDMEVD